MTLETRVRITEPITAEDAWRIFRKAQSLLGSPETMITELLGSFYDNPGITNMPDQGLPALLALQHNHGKPLVDDPDGDWPTCWAQISFDTTYGYSDEFGGPGTLHARLVAQLGEWLDQQGWTWQWMDEHSGAWYSGYSDLGVLIGHGRDAQTWFASILPVLARKIGFEGSPTER